MELPQLFHGVVVHGLGRGHKTLGFPTANLSPDKWSVHVTESDYGVYCGLVTIGTDPLRIGVLSIGKNLTFNDEKPSFEVHILDFDGDLYGVEIEVNVTHFLRPMISFKSIDQLILQIKADLEDSRKLLKNMF